MFIHADEVERYTDDNTHSLSLYTQTPLFDLV